MQYALPLTDGDSLPLSKKNMRRACKVMHLIWIDPARPGASLPSRYLENKESWKRHNPGANVWIWTEKDVVSLIAREFPEFENVYLRLVTPIQKADLARLLILYEHGGTYVDCDVLCKKPVCFLNCNEKENIERCGGDDHDDNHEEPGIVYNGETRDIWLVRSPLFSEVYQNCLMTSCFVRDPFWRDVAERVRFNMERIDQHSNSATFWWKHHIAGYVLRVIYTTQLTGPACIDRVLAEKSVYHARIGTFGSDYYQGDVLWHAESGEWCPFLSPRVLWHLLLSLIRAKFISVVFHSSLTIF